jgi:transcription elongation factor Elf1
MTCTHCNDTGSLSKDIEGFFDCGHCSVAGERTALEAWADANHVECYSADLWRIYQHGKAATTGSAA